MWAYRHKLQNEAHNVGKTLPLDLRTSLRFEAEFERALEQRGAQAKKAMEDRANRRGLGDGTEIPF
jgi:hypothetical protein